MYRRQDRNGGVAARAIPADILVEARDRGGPVSVLRGGAAGRPVGVAASITLRYSDSPGEVAVAYRGAEAGEEVVGRAEASSYEGLRIQA